MPYAYYDWLSVSDIGMLAMEGESAHMHMGGVTILDPGPLWDEERGLDSQAIERYVSSRLHLIPRYRQRLAWSPIERRPVWIDDARFNIHYHVRHSSLPRAATERQLKRLVGRILSQQLDRDKPLWEMWFIEGLPDDRLAMVTKIHHCVVDGMAGMSLMVHLMRPDPDMEVEPPHPWIPRVRPRSSG